MSQTCRCGAQLLASVTFCVECGASAAPQLLVAAAATRAEHPLAGWSVAASPALPHRSYAAAPQRPSRAGTGAGWPRTLWITVGAATVTLVLLVVGAVLAARASAPAVAAAAPIASAPPAAATGPGSYASSSPGSSSSGSGATAATYPGESSPSTPGSTSAGSSSEATSSSGAQEELTSMASSDSAEVSSLADQWVPQLSSKQLGMVVQGVTYDYPAILADHEALRSRYPQARLLLSDDWPVFNGTGYWVTVVAEPFSTADGANAWCDQQGIGPNDCFAKKLSHTSGPQGTTKLRS
ncbi:hypothetical protein LQ327_09465 [Actinomycetospora endophytica]|uniref:Sporulation related protein n=1 Tax=Actinomycetospora endophytica TaxID=2291215 RepID=A0ABS8P5T1_9PSEU|nr:hypothetical protein [Actinomycetospora endophytica]MCD2193608.1 hypothetical protein [Actinomycetospora endophytica]